MKKMMMIAAMMLMSIGAFAQNEVGQVTLKPMVGMNLATMTKVDDSKMRVGLTAGVEAEYGVAQNFSVTAGLLYSMQGVKNEGTADIDLSFLGYDVRVPFTGKQTVKLDYLNIPILANYYIVPGLAIKAGIQPGFCVSKKQKIEGTVSYQGVSQSVESDEKINDGVKSFAFAIPVGLSYEFSDFVVDARYNIGVTKALDNVDSRHSVFTFTLGYKFAL